MDVHFGMRDAPPVTLDTAMTEADFSNKNLGVSGAIILAAVLRCKTFRDRGSLSKLDLSGNNNTGSKSPDFIRPIASALKTNTSITELNLSRNRLNAEATVILSKDMKDMGSLSKLKMDKYELPVREIKTATELDLSNKDLGELDAIVIAVLITVCKLDRLSTL
jgi:hypothetical protein